MIEAHLDRRVAQVDAAVAWYARHHRIGETTARLALSDQVRRHLLATPALEPVAD